MLAKLLGRQETVHAAVRAAIGEDIRPTENKPNRRGYKRQQVAEMFGCHVATIDRLIASGKLKAHKLSARNVTILDADIELFIADHQIKPA
jgi:excisionase family DNA binding protein